MKDLVVLVFFGVTLTLFGVNGKIWKTCELARALANEGIPRSLISNCEFREVSNNIKPVLKFHFCCQLQMFALQKRLVLQTLTKSRKLHQQQLNTEFFKSTTRNFAEKTENQVANAT
jgi:hypothetical protein